MTRKEKVAVVTGVIQGFVPGFGIILLCALAAAFLNLR